VIGWVSYKVHSMRAVIGITERMPVHRHVMRITIAGIRIRISAGRHLQIQENLTNLRSQLLTELTNLVERQNTQRRENRLVSL
jgi:hypothetical protein